MNKKKNSEFFDRSEINNDLKNKSDKGRIYTFLSQGISFFFQIGTTVILARLVSPQHFGLVAMVVSITGFAGIFRTFGLSQATIQRDNITHEQVSTLFWINTIVGCALMVITIASSSFIAWFYNDSRLIKITIIISTSFLFSGLAVQHNAILRRQMQFGRIALVIIISKAISTALAITFAFQFTGYWSIVILHVSDHVLISIGVFLACKWRPGLPVRNSGARKLIKFGFDVTLFNLITYISKNIDKILLGKIYGPAIVGFYDKANQLIRKPIDQLRLPLFSVSMPGLSTLQSNQVKYKHYFLEFVQSTSLILMPISCFCALYAREIVIVFLGNKWLASAEILRIMGITQCIRSAMTTLDQIPLSLGKSKKYLLLGLLNNLFSTIGIIIGLKWGGIGVASGYLAATIITFSSYTYLCLKGTNIHFIDFSKSISKAIIICLILILLYFIIKFSLNHLNEFIVFSTGSFSLFSVIIWIVINRKRYDKQFNF